MMFVESDWPLLGAVIFAVMGLVTKNSIRTIYLLFLMGFSVTFYLLVEGMEYLGLLNFFMTIGFSSVGYIFVTSVRPERIRFEWTNGVIVWLVLFLTGLLFYRDNLFENRFEPSQWMRGAHDLEELGKEMMSRSAVHLFLLVAFLISSLVGVLCLARIELRRKY